MLGAAKNRLVLLLLFTITVQLQFEDYVQIKTTITKQSKGYTES